MISEIRKRFIAVYDSRMVCLRSYSVQLPELGCYGHKEYSAGVRNYGKKDPKELFDVYCFAKELQGEHKHTHDRSHTHKKRGVFQFVPIFLHHIVLRNERN